MVSSILPPGLQNRSRSILPLVFMGLLLQACSSSSSTPSPNPVASDDPTLTPVGTPPIVNVEVEVLTPEDFTAPPGQDQSMFDTLSATGRFTQLLSYIDETGLSEDILNGDAVTLFAPDDDAFAAFTDAVNVNSLDSQSAEELRDRFLYHAIVGNALDSTSLRQYDDRALEMANELPAAINISNDGALLINGAVLTSTDLITSNGIVHAIDRVLTPPLRPGNPNDTIPPPSDVDIASTLLLRSDYSILIQLIERAGLSEQLQGDNNGEGWTIFAPSDSAFEQGSGDVFSLDEQEASDLVRLHLLSGRHASDMLPVGELNMVQGTVLVDIEDGSLTVGGATIVGRDRVVGNGIIHFVDRALVPSTP